MEADTSGAPTARRQATPRPFPSRVEGLCPRLAWLPFPENQFLARFLLTYRRGAPQSPCCGKPRRMKATFHLFPGDLAGDIHAAEESTEVPSKSHKHHGDRLDGQPITGQNSFLSPLRPYVDEANYPDQQAGCPTENQMQQKDAFESL